MKTLSRFGSVQFALSLAVGALISCTTLAAERPLLTQAEATINPFAVRDVREDLQSPPTQRPGSALSPHPYSRPVAAIDPLCRETNALAIDLGHGPARRCSGELNRLPGSSGAQHTASDADAGSDSSPAATDVPSELVLLVHGFSLTSGHHCGDYWQRQKAEIEKQGRIAKIVGYYQHNHGGCDVDLSVDNDFTNASPLEDVARALRDWILSHHAGSYIDIVAHSMGGIVVRKMLQDWGHELLIANVVTLGTPHGGVQTLFLNGSCALIPQCLQMSAGSSFMNSLAHNPQSIVPTQWTLIAASGDQVVGYGTGTQMQNGSAGGPAVSRYNYPYNRKHNCNVFASSVAHGDLHGDKAAWAVHRCSNYGTSLGTVLNPHTRIMHAID